MATRKVAGKTAESSVVDLGNGRVQITLVMERKGKVLLRERGESEDPVEHIVDRGKYDPGAALRHCFEYGEGRFHRDGAKTRAKKVDAKGEAIKDKAGKVQYVPGDEEQLTEWAQAHADKRSEVLMGNKFLSERAAKVPAIVQEMRLLLNLWISTNLTDKDGKKYTAKTIPVQISRGTDLSSLKSSCMDLNMPPKIWDAIQKQGQISVDARAAIAGIKIKV